MARPLKKTNLALRGGAIAKAGKAIATGSFDPPLFSIAGGAQAVPHYRDRHEEYELVTRDDLRELRTFGWLEQTLFGVGSFFFSGAFWLLMDLLAHQEKREFTAWMGMCLISIVAGGVLAAVGLILFYLKQKRLEKYFPRDSDMTTRSKSPAYIQSQPARQAKTSRRSSGVK